MDSHYDMVMKARQQAGQGRRLYFAYSTILDRSAFEQWRAQHHYEFFDLPQGRPAEALDLTLVYDFPSRWWGGRVAGLMDAAQSVVHGLIFDISEQDWPIIQHKEGAITGMCVERQVRVKTGGDIITATAFTTNPARASTEGPVSERFVQALISGAMASQLPGEWVAQLKSLAR